MPAAPRRPSTPVTRQVNFRLPHDVWQWLDAAAGVLGQPQSKIVTDALKVYAEAMPATKRRVIDDAVSIRKKP